MLADSYRYESPFGLSYALPWYGITVVFRSTDSGTRSPSVVTAGRAPDVAPADRTGESWSHQELDNNPTAATSGLVMDPKGSTEIYAAQAKDGSVVALVRNQYHSPHMWLSRSTSGGATWAPQSRAPFPMYSCTMTATKSGVLLISGRFPGAGLQASWDAGHTWQAYTIDTPPGVVSMIEVEPDVVVVTAAGMENGNSTAPRYQLFRVLHEPPSIEPLIF